MLQREKSDFFISSYTSMWEIRTLCLFILGFICLIKGADILIEWASSLAKKANISNMIIGLTIVWFGTSAPELLVNISSSLKGITGITIGNIIWSNISNILLILWASAIFHPLLIKKKLLLNEVLFTLFATLIFACMINDHIIDHSSFDIVSRSEGMILLILFGIFLYYVYRNINKWETREQEKGEIRILPLRKSCLRIALWLWGLILGGERIVNGATLIARYFGLSERVIGLTIIAIGTSLPELATSIIAAYKKNTDLALWNIIWSNIFNILFILGVSSIITPIPWLHGTNIDLILLLLATILIYIFAFRKTWGKQREINRREGILMLGIYLWYLSYLIIS